MKTFVIACNQKDKSYILSCVENKFGTLNKVEAWKNMDAMVNQSILIIFNPPYIPDLFLQSFRTIGIKLAGFKTSIPFMYEVLNAAFAVEKIKQNL